MRKALAMAESLAPARFGLGAVAGATHGFNGAEVELALVAAMYAALSAEREVTTADVLTAAGEERQRP